MQCGGDGLKGTVCGSWAWVHMVKSLMGGLARILVLGQHPAYILYVMGCTSDADFCCELLPIICRFRGCALQAVQPGC